MPGKFKVELTEWTKGAITDTQADKVPDNASPRARNTAWVKLGFPSRRKGCSIITQTGETIDAPATLRPAILALGHFQDLNWTIADNGRWSKIVDGEFDPIDASNQVPFTTGTHIPSTAIANNHLFAVNGEEAMKTDGTTITKFGIDAPDAPTVTDEGSAGNPDGTYRVALTAFNEDTGHESSLSAPDEVTVATNKIKVAWTFPADTQVTHVRVHIFKVGLTDRFFQLTATNVTPDAGAYDSDAGGYTDATSYVVINVTDTDITNLIIQSPDDHENDPPPANATFIAYHGSRMWATDGVDLWYSKVDDPESFDPRRTEQVNPENDQDIISFGTDPDEQLVILKELSSYVLTGPNDPNVWEIKDLDITIGSRASRTLVTAEGALWWAAPQGFFSKEAGKLPERMDAYAIGNHVETLNFSHRCVGGYDVIRQRVLFAVPEEGATRNTIIFPYNTRLKIWEDQWDPMDISCFGTFIDASTDTPFVAIGGYGGRVFRLWDTPYVDGVRLNDGAGNDFTLTGHLTSVGGSAEFTDINATFDTDGDGLAEIPVVFVSLDNVVIRNIISANTVHRIITKNNWATVPDSTWTYYIGSPNFEFDIKHLSPDTGGGPTSLNSRRFKRATIKGVSDTGQATLDVFAIINGVDNPFGRHFQVNFSGSGALWDVDQWDQTVFGNPEVSVSHRTIAKHGQTCGLRFICRTPGVGATLLTVGMMGTELSYKG